MPTVSYDFNEAGDFADFVTLEAGNYVFKFSEADASQKSKAGNPKAIVDLIVTAASPANSWAVGGLSRQHLPTRGEASGRFRDLLAALGVPAKKKGSLKLEKYYGNEIGARVTKVAGDKPDAEGNTMWFNDLKQIMPGEQMRAILGLEDEEEEVEDEEEDIEEVEEEEEEEKEVEEDDEDEEEEEEDEEDEEDEDEDDYEEDEEEEEEEEELSLEDLKGMKLAELKELGKEYDISTRAPKGKKLTSAIMRKRLATLWDDDEEEDEEDPF